MRRRFGSSRFRSRQPGNRQNGSPLAGPTGGPLPSPVDPGTLQREGVDPIEAPEVGPIGKGKVGPAAGGPNLVAAGPETMESDVDHGHARWKIAEIRRRDGQPAPETALHAPDDLAPDPIGGPGEGERGVTREGDDQKTDDTDPEEKALAEGQR